MPQGPQDPAVGGIVVAKSDTVDIFAASSPDTTKGLYKSDGGGTGMVQDSPYATRGLYVGGAGDVAVIMANGSPVTFVGVIAGTLLPISCTRVLSAGTTATNMVALF